jgi:hypothetical protein
MLYEIQQGEEILSTMEILKGTLSVKYNNKERILNSLINYYQNDSLPASSDSLVLVLLNDNTLHNRYKLITLYVKEKDAANAEYWYNRIPTDFELNDDEYFAYEQYSTILDIQTGLIINQQTYFDIDSNQKADLYNLSEDYVTYAGAYARNILTLIDSVEFDLPLPEDGGGLKRTQIYEAPTETFIQKPKFAIHPNPAKEYIIVDYKTEYTESINGFIKIADATGREIIFNQLNCQRIKY